MTEQLNWTELNWNFFLSSVFFFFNRYLLEYSLFKMLVSGLPCGSVVKDLPSNVGNMGSIPDGEDPTCFGSTKPVRHNFWGCALKPGSCNYWSSHALEPVLSNKKRARTAAREQSPLSTTRGSQSSNKDLAQPKINFFKKNVNFCCTAKWISYTCTYIHSF